MAGHGALLRNSFRGGEPYSLSALAGAPGDRRRWLAWSISSPVTDSMSKHIAASLTLILLVPLASAQLREPGTPASFRARLPANVPTLVFPVPNAGELLAASQASSGGRLEYGV